MSYWNGGFDEAWAADKPALVTILAAIEHAWAAGDRRFDLGAGGQPYKYRFADGQDEVEWVRLVPRGPRYPLARLSLVPLQARRGVAARLSDDAKERLRRAIPRRTDRVRGAPEP